MMPIGPSPEEDPGLGAEEFPEPERREDSEKEAADREKWDAFEDEREMLLDTKKRCRRLLSNPPWERPLDLFEMCDDARLVVLSALTDEERAATLLFTPREDLIYTLGFMTLTLTPNAIRLTP